MTEAAAMENRIFRGMTLIVAVSVPASVLFGSWRVTTGLFLGGVLGILNHHWLRTSVASVFSSASRKGTKPGRGAARYLLRYFVIAAVITLAYKADVMSIGATFLGMCSFLIAAMIEAFRQCYLAIINRQEST